MATPLNAAEIVGISGPDGLAFAHAQFTSDVNALPEGAWQWSAWLTAQGRVRHFFALLRPDSTHLIAWLPLGGAEMMRKALGRFVLRTKVELNAQTNWMLMDANDGHPFTLPPNNFEFLNDGFEFILLGTPIRRARLQVFDGAAPTLSNSLAQWRLADIEAGLPFIAPELSEEFVPAALNLERWNAISYNKGCYPGQEIVARMHFKGGNKRTLVRLQADLVAPTLPGARIYAHEGSESVGRILYATPAGDITQALAVLNENIIASTRLRLENGTHSQVIKNTNAVQAYCEE